MCLLGLTLDTALSAARWVGGQRWRCGGRRRTGITEISRGHLDTIQRYAAAGHYEIIDDHNIVEAIRELDSQQTELLRRIKRIEGVMISETEII